MEDAIDSVLLFELVANPAGAKVLRPTVALSLLAEADEVIK
jgi:hypothetical protein